MDLLGQVCMAEALVSAAGLAMSKRAGGIEYRPPTPQPPHKGATPCFLSIFPHDTITNVNFTVMLPSRLMAAMGV